MSFALFVIGIVLLTSAVKNTQGDLFSLVQGDFVGPNNFVYWFLSILLIGAIGYIPKLKPFSVAFLVLVVLVLVLTRGNPNGVGGGLFSQLTKQLNTTQTTSTVTTEKGGTSQQATTISPVPSLTLPTLP